MSILKPLSLLLMLSFSGVGWANSVLILGDSISAGYGIEVDKGWVSLLRQRLQQTGLADPERVVNASISGETTSGGLTRLPELLARHQPKLVVIELGANDGLRGTPLNAVEGNLNQLVLASKQAGAEVMMLGMRIPPNYGRRYTEAFYQLFARVAEGHQVAYFPFFLEGVGGHPELMQLDGLHPNGKAQPRLLDNVWPLFESLLTH